MGTKGKNPGKECVLISFRLQDTRQVSDIDGSTQFGTSEILTDERRGFALMLETEW